MHREPPEGKHVELLCVRLAVLLFVALEYVFPSLFLLSSRGRSVPARCVFYPVSCAQLRWLPLKGPRGVLFVLLLTAVCLFQARILCATILSNVKYVVGRMSVVEAPLVNL